MSNYTGIDYGGGKANVDKATGIHYGVISQHSVNAEAVDEIFRGPNSRDLNYEAYVKQVKDSVREAVRQAMDSCMLDSKAEELADFLADEAEGWDWLGDCYNGDEIDPLYEADGYKVTKCLDADLFILQSPFYTHAQYCSPCVPGAGNIDSPCEDGPKTFCLGHDWFDDGQAPYPVFSVVTGLAVDAGKERVS